MTSSPFNFTGQSLTLLWRFFVVLLTLLSLATWVLLCFVESAGVVVNWLLLFVISAAAVSAVRGASECTGVTT